MVPDYDWEYYRFRVLEYFALCTDSCNARGFDDDQLKEILARTEELWEMWHSNPEKFKEFDDEQYLKFLLLRNRYLAGVSGEEAYRKSMMQMFRERKKENYDLCGIIDTVFVYGRKLLDMEFDLIKTHPQMGAEILRRFPFTRQYAEVALGHHKWYDNSRGYPEEFYTSESPLKVLIDLVMCCDCLDAATDTVGRSYNRGKSKGTVFVCCVTQISGMAFAITWK